jgi:hypothetical protein
MSVAYRTLARCQSEHQPAKAKNHPKRTGKLALRFDNLGSLSAHSLPGLLGHRDAFALETFHEFDFEPLLFEALQVLTDESSDVITWRAVVGRAAALFHKLLQVFRKPESMRRHDAYPRLHVPTYVLSHTVSVFQAATVDRALSG